MLINTELCLSDATSGFTPLCGASLIHLAFKLQAGVGLSKGTVSVACTRLRVEEQPKLCESISGHIQVLQSSVDCVPTGICSVLHLWLIFPTFISEGPVSSTRQTS